MTKTPKLEIEYGNFEFLKNLIFQVPTIFVTKKNIKITRNGFCTGSLSFLTI